MQNPYPAPVPLRIVDQLPLQGDKNIEVQLVDAQGAEREEGTGKLTWRVTAPASGKFKLAFVYQLKRCSGMPRREGRAAARRRAWKRRSRDSRCSWR